MTYGSLHYEPISPPHVTAVEEEAWICFMAQIAFLSPRGTTGFSSYFSIAEGLMLIREP